MLTIEELLKPRYKVIADFPQWSTFKHKKGDILELRGIHFVGHGTSKSINEKEIDLYPEVIKRLEWWGGREEKDMPEYVKYLDTSTFFPTLHVCEGKYAPINSIGYTTEALYPATKEEFEEYINQKQ